MTGTCVVFNRDRGYGRIRPDNPGDYGEMGEVFVGDQDLPRDVPFLVGTQRVEFTPEYQRRYRGYRAREVRLLPQAVSGMSRAHG